MRYPKEWRTRAGGDTVPPAVRDAGRKLLGYLEEQRRLGGVQTLYKEVVLSDGTRVVGQLVFGKPMVDYYPPAEDNPPPRPGEYALYAALGDVDKVAVVDLQSGRLKTHIDLTVGDPGAHFPYDVQALGREVWVVCQASRKVKVLSIDSHEVLATADLSAAATSLNKMCFSVDGSRAFVTGENALPNAGPYGSFVYVIDTATRFVIGAAQSGPLTDVGSGTPLGFGIAVNPQDPTQMYVTDHSSQSTAVHVINLVGGNTPAVSGTIACQVGDAGKFCTHVEFSPDGEKALVTRLGTAFSSTYVIDTATDTLTASITRDTGSFPTAYINPGYLALFPNSNRYAAVSSRDSETLDIIDFVDNLHVASEPVYTGADPKIVLPGSLVYGVAVHPEGGKAYIAKHNARTIVSVLLGNDPSIFGELSQDDGAGGRDPVLEGEPWGLCIATIYPRSES